MVSLLLPVLVFAIFSIPMLVAFGPVLALEPMWLKLSWLGLSPFAYVFLYVTIAGLLCNLGKKAIVRGTFPRDLKHKVYGPRRLYGICWTSIYYFTPVYFACLSFPKLRGYLFRLFGYKGSNDITIYPDVWLRDLPMLNFEDKVYVANRTTVGTNVCLSDGSIIVDRISLGKGALVGHMSVLGPGIKLEENVELGVRAGLGIRVRLQKGAKVGPCVSIHHGASVGENAEIGVCSFIGLRARIGANIKVPGGANIPAGAEINTQEEMNSYLSSETKLLTEQRISAMENFLGGLKKGSPGVEDGDPVPTEAA